MSALMSNWKFLMFVYIITFGLWGFLIKFVSKELDWKTTMTYVWCTIFIILFFLYFRKESLAFSKNHMLAILAGVLATIGTVVFYKSVSLAPASIIMPLSGLQIVLTVVLAIVFLNEALTLKIFFGICSSFLAIYLLTS
jgi:transporter family protein